MTEEELYKVRRALSVVSDLRLYGNTHELPFAESKFLNLYGKCAEDMEQLLDLMYRPLAKNGKSRDITEATTIKASRAAATILKVMDEVLETEERDKEK
jgi:hypothetical protein